MATHRGSDGFLSLGGARKGSAYVKGAVAQGVSSLTLDGNGAALSGVIMPGDTFTVAGDAQEYTVVSGGVIGSSVASELAGVTFTPTVVPGGGWADNAAITFASNSVGETRKWETNATRAVLDDTVMGDTAETARLDILKWVGKAECLLDKGDTKQNLLINAVLSGTATGQYGLMLGLGSGKALWGDIVANNFAIVSQRGALVTVAFTFEGTGAVSVDWN